MITKKFLWIVLVIAGLAVIFPTFTYAGQGNENFIFVNYIGQEIVLDLDDATYIVPGTSVAPDGGRLMLQLAAGQHKYAANAPGVPTGSAGEFTIAPGDIVAKAARLEKTPYKLDAQGIVIAKPEDYVFIFDFNPMVVPVAATTVIDTWQPAAAASGKGSLVWINYYDNELTVDLAGQVYKVPPQTGNIPGRLQIDSTPGLYRYTVSVPYASLNGEITAVAGQVLGMSLTADVAPLKKFGIGDKYDPAPDITLHLAQEDLTGQVSSVQAETPPGVLPETGGELVVAPPVETQGLVLRNYAGDTLVFTINNQTYTIANNTEQTLDLPPGHYTYTASLPFVATNGAVDVVVGQGVVLSIARDVNQGWLNVYQN